MSFYSFLFFFFVNTQRHIYLCIYIYIFYLCLYLIFMKHSAIGRNWYPVLSFHKQFSCDIYLVTMFCPFSLASQNNYRINSNQELLAIGKTPAAGGSQRLGGGGADT